MLIYPKSSKIELTMPIRKITNYNKQILKALDGSMTIYKAKKDRIFIDKFYVIDEDLNKPSIATNQTKIDVYEISDFTSHSEKFFSVSDDLDSLCLTQHQIIEFSINFRDYIYPQKKKNGVPIFFLLKPDEDLILLNPEEQHLVACVYPIGDELAMDIEDLQIDKKGNSDRLVRFIVPIQI
ncbi:MAG TPA: hypothetical protein PL089_12780 [Ignavibacteria bacterium]|nr:hypothetical protein [Ignavibacteria bacterium]